MACLTRRMGDRGCGLRIPYALATAVALAVLGLLFLAIENEITRHMWCDLYTQAVVDDWRTVQIEYAKDERYMDGLFDIGLENAVLAQTFCR